MADHANPYDALNFEICETCRSTLSSAWNSLSDDISLRPTYGEAVVGRENSCSICSWIYALHVNDGQHIHPANVKDLPITIVTRWKAPSTRELNFIAGYPGAESPKATLYMEKEDPTGGLGIELSHRRLFKPDPYTGSNEVLETIRHWIGQCEAHHHQYCRSALLHTASTWFFPTRIVDTAMAGTGFVHIRHRHEILRHDILGSGEIFPVYWTLSHRWGAPKLRLVQDILVAAQQEGLCLSDLTSTFQDAISLVRRLGYRYLWIDCLCIVQDSTEDWARESAAMEDIYSHSHCNISALAASSAPGTGLFRQRSFGGMFLRPQQIALDGFTGYLSDGSGWETDVENAPLSNRAWVVQERFLSRRVLHFAKSQIYWECLENAHSEAGGSSRRWRNYPYSEPEHPSAYKVARRTLIDIRALRASRSDRSHISQWCRLVSIYATCHLTEETDRLVAMHGIAKTFNMVNESTDMYLAGLWKSTLHIDLSWDTGGPKEEKTCTRHRSHATCVPTWSWASVAGGTVNVSPSHTRFSNPPLSLIQLIDARIVPEEADDIFGRLSTAELVIRAMIYPFRSSVDNGGLVVYRDDMMTQTYFRKASSDLKLDTWDLMKRFATDDGIEGLCVPIDAGYHGYGGGQNVFLMLEKNYEGKYERLGVFNHGEIGNWIQDIIEPMEEIILI